MISNSEENTPLSDNMKGADWVRFLKENITPADIDDETTYSFLHYLEDLKLIIRCANDDLRWQGLEECVDEDENKQNIKNGILQMSQTESGFALPFFIGFESIELPAIESLIRPESKKVKNKDIPQPEPASDLSNLQIVKKVGRQLKPFLEAESTIVSRLIGERTTKTDARYLFQYIFGKINSKAQPRKWEQLSRKRHR